MKERAACARCHCVDPSSVGNGLVVINGLRSGSFTMFSRCDVDQRPERVRIVTC